MESQHEINAREWRDTRNWRGGFLGIYHSRRDSRPVVPKRNRWMGATFNLGHPLGKALMLVVVAVIVAALVLAFWLE